MAESDDGTPLEPFFTKLFARDAAGGSWLSALLTAAPHADRLGELAKAPGWLQTQLAVRGASGRLACFEYPAVAPRRLLRWFIDHPEQLVWPDDVDVSASAETVLLRRALINDEPPGSRRGRRTGPASCCPAAPGLTPAWWRFEDMRMLDCVLITERMVVTVQATRTEEKPATPWYPKRSQLVRNLEAARRLADGKRFATLVLSERPLPEADDEFLERTLPEAAPHLDELEQRELRDAYLGNLTWDAAYDAVGCPEGVDRGHELRPLAAAPIRSSPRFKTTPSAVPGTKGGCR